MVRGTPPVAKSTYTAQTPKKPAHAHAQRQDTDTHTRTRSMFDRTSTTCATSGHHSARRAGLCSIILTESMLLLHLPCACCAEHPP